MLFTTKEIKKIVKDQYNIKAQVKALSGYDDYNYMVTADDNTKYILKVSTETRKSFLEAQIEILDHLAHTRSSSCFQKHIPNTKGELITTVKGINNNPCYIRMLTWIEGTFWTNIKHKSKHLFYQLGGFLGYLDKSCKDIYIDAVNRKYIWDISHTAEAKKKLHFIKNHEIRRLTDYFFLQFESHVLPALPELRYACIHNDANDQNILTDGSRITGLIDFGDMVWAPLINNLAIACTYTTMDSEFPLEDACHLVHGYNEIYPLKEEEIDLLYYLIAARLCISITQSAEKASTESLNKHHFNSESSAWTLLKYWITINPLYAQDQFRIACDMSPTIEQSIDHSKLIQLRKKIIGYNLSLSYDRPLKIIQGAFQYLYDDTGYTYLDCVNNVSHVGHCHPTVVRAMQKQVATLNTNTRYLHDTIVAYAKSLTDTLPSKLKVCYFVNSGSEANDLAIRMARNYTKKQDIIVLDHAYHGTSSLAMDMSPYKFEGKGGQGQRSFIHKAPVPDCYRGKYQYDDGNAGKHYADEVLTILQNIKSTGKGIAAFICETLLGVGGQMPLPDGYLKEVYAHIRAYGGVCIADEVQVGLGRIGRDFWGFNMQDAEPDIVVVGKPIGNGHPLAAVIVTEKIAKAFDNGMEYFNTYGGNPVSMAAGLAVLNVIQDEELANHAVEAGRILIEGFKGLAKKHKCIGDVRGVGLFVGVEIVKDNISKTPDADLASYIVEKMKQSRYLLSTDGPHHNVLKIKPPLVISIENCQNIVSLIDHILKRLPKK